MRATDPSLATSLCGIALSDPVLAASGTLSREPIEGNPPARLYETQAGMVNSVGFQNVGVRAFVRDKLPGLADPAPLAEVVSAVRPGVRCPRLGADFGGLSAPAIKPIALRMVYQAARAVKIPVAGMGDISTGRDAAEFMIAGASAVQVGTANSGTRPCRCASRRNWRA